MGKILQFKRVRKETPARETALDGGAGLAGLSDDINVILNDHSLTAANRHWILENMLMDIDDQLDWYRKELEKAEKKLDELVHCAEQDIAAAYREFESDVSGMTAAVRKLTRSLRKSRLPQLPEAAIRTDRR